MPEQSQDERERNGTGDLTCVCPLCGEGVRPCYCKRGPDTDSRRWPVGESLLIAALAFLLTLVFSLSGAAVEAGDEQGETQGPSDAEYIEVIADYIREVNPAVDDPRGHANQIVYVSNLRDLDPLLLTGVAEVESTFRPTAYYLGNYGVVQVNCTVHLDSYSEIDECEDLFDRDVCYLVGSSILRGALDYADGNQFLAARVYNGGAAGYDEGDRAKETRAYAIEVTSIRDELRDRLAD